MLVWLAGCSAGNPGFTDLANLERPSSPNTYLVCPADRTTAKIDQEPPLYPVDAAALWQRWSTAVPEEPRVATLARDDPGRRLLVVQRTPFLRFPDVVQLEVYEVTDETSTLCLYSRSVYGYSDFGANRRRVESWLAQIGR